MTTFTSTLKYRLLPLILCLAGCIQAFADNDVETILSSYTPWTTVRLEGKLEADRLPLSPTVKIFMRKGSEIQISLSAPLVGEVGRVEITNNNILAVNKMRGVYCRENISAFISQLPFGISDIQSLLLGRIFLLGNGELTKDNASEFVIAPLEDRPGWDVYPNVMPFIDGYEMGYAFSTFDDGRTDLLYATYKGQEAAVGYSYGNKGYDIVVAFGNENHLLEAQIPIKKVDFNNAKPLDPVNIRSSWRQVDAAQFLKSLK